MPIAKAIREIVCTISILSPCIHIKLICFKFYVKYTEKITIPASFSLAWNRFGLYLRYEFLDRYKEGLKPEEIKQIYREAFFCDAYFTSTNAITEDGELYNVDGNGNRVAAMLYGPDKVIVIAGVNKIVKNINEAISRVENLAAPANAKRLNRKTPCVITGKCMNCNSPERICREYTVIRKPAPNRIFILLLNENYGY